jgi:teichuronic acid biosynthesis glycosyltransferase TuaG
MENVEFSVIIPTHNSDKFLDKAFDSVFNQTFLGFEVCVADDHSTDDTKELLLKWQKKFLSKKIQFKLCESPLRGAGAARNAAIDLATGQFLAFLDSDDIWHPLKLERSHIALHPGQANAFSHFEHYVRLDGRVQISRNGYDQTTEFQKELYKGNKLSTSALVAKRELFVRSPVFSVDYCSSQDYECWLSIIKSVTLTSSSEILGSYIERAESISSWPYSIRAKNLIRILWKYRHISYTIFLLRIFKVILSRQWYFQMKNYVQRKKGHAC